jgi:hypothetical protein
VGAGEREPVGCGLLQRGDRGQIEVWSGLKRIDGSGTGNGDLECESSVCSGPEV